ncbi:MAG: phosphoglucosamine mutase [Thermoplasmatota archaeon]
MGKLFGTNGVRGLANVEMTPELAMKLGRAFASTLPEGSRVLVGRDTRTSGPVLVAALAAGLAASGARVADAGIVPTPALQLAVRDRAFAAGAVVTASHNPPEFNGIKFIDDDGTEFPPEKEDAVETLFFAERFRSAPWRSLGGVDPEPAVNDDYVRGVVAHVDVEKIRARKFTVALDTSNGAGGLTAPFVLAALGCRVITLNAQLDGTFPGHNSEPVPENVQDLIRTTKAAGADLGVVQDGDADRCVFVTEKGEYVFGDRTLTLAASEAVRAAKAKGAARPLIVTPVSSSSIVEEAVAAAGGRLEYTRVGAPIVARKMIATKATLGGEDNGGVIWPDFQYCRDASMTMAKILEILAHRGKPLSLLLDALPTAALVKLKTKCPNDKKERALVALAAAHQGEKVDTTDGVKIYSKEGWVLVRPSGTEPIFRVMAEAKTEDAAQAIAKRAMVEIEAIIARA